MNKIGFGGGCHWCTEAVFQFFDGVEKVEQGWIESNSPHNSFSEAVIVHFDPEKIDLETLIEAHLMTHSSTSNHSFREKYRSAIYHFSEMDKKMAEKILARFKVKHKLDYILKILPFKKFKPNTEEYLNYYLKNQEAPFCSAYILPKLKKLKAKYPTKKNKREIST